MAQRLMLQLAKSPLKVLHNLWQCLTFYCSSSMTFNFARRTPSLSTFGQLFHSQQVDLWNPAGIYLRHLATMSYRELMVWVWLVWFHLIETSAQQWHFQLWPHKVGPLQKDPQHEVLKPTGKWLKTWSEWRDIVWQNCFRNLHHYVLPPTICA